MLEKASKDSSLLGLGAIYIMPRTRTQGLEEPTSPATVEDLGGGEWPLFTENPRRSLYAGKIGVPDGQQQLLWSHPDASCTLS
jgi:hypothetical protein